MIKSARLRRADAEPGVHAAGPTQDGPLRFFEREELVRLRQENRLLRYERDILVRLAEEFARMAASDSER